MSIEGFNGEENYYSETSNKHKGDVMERREWRVGSRSSRDATIYEGGRWIAQVGIDYADIIVNDHNQHAALVEQWDLLTRTLANVIDANYGTSYHHIGDGDGIPEEQAKEIQEWWQAHLQQIQDEYNRKQALATVEQGHKEQASAASGEGREL